MTALSDYLELTDADANDQWSAIRERQLGQGRWRFVPVETILCYGLLRVVPNPHRYGSKTHPSAPQIVHTLARLLRRNPSSLILKMVNLNGRLPNGAKFDLPFFLAMADAPMHYRSLYEIVIQSARMQGIGGRELPDFLENIADEAVVNPTIDLDTDPTIQRQVEALDSSIGGTPRALPPGDTTRLVTHRTRIGQDAFSITVRQRFGHTCGFCGFSPRSILKEGLLWGSHIKPWSESNDDERLDPLNGIAACRMHDAAFDRGLITVENDLRILKAQLLRSSIDLDPGVGQYFGSAMQDRLVLPPSSEPPLTEYLEWHRLNRFRDKFNPDPESVV